MSFNVITTSYFQKEAKRLSKKYPSFKKDFSQFIESLTSNPLQGVELYPGIRKISLQIKSKGKGKSGGARVITFNIFVDNQNGEIFLLLIYDKEDVSTVDVNIVKRIVKDLGLEV